MRIKANNTDLMPFELSGPRCECPPNLSSSWTHELCPYNTYTWQLQFIRLGVNQTVLPTASLSLKVAQHMNLSESFQLLTWLPEKTYLYIYLYRYLGRLFYPEVVVNTTVLKQYSFSVSKPLTDTVYNINSSSVGPFKLFLI